MAKGIISVGWGGVLQKGHVGKGALGGGGHEA